MSIDEIKNLILKSALQAPAPDNIPPAKFSWDKSRIYIDYDSLRVEGLTFGKMDMATYLSFGACLENIEQISKALGCSSKANLEEQIFVDIDFSSIDQTQSIDVLNNYSQLPLYKRHTNRLPFRKKDIPDEIPRAIPSQASGLEDVTVSGYTEKHQIKEWTKLVRIASEARFQIQQAHEWLGQSLRFGSQAELTGDGLDIATLNLPPGGSLFLKFISPWPRMQKLNLAKTYKLLGMIESQPVSQSSMVVAISAKNSRKSQINAGRAMQRIWIWLNENNLAVQPYYVIPDLINRHQQHNLEKHLTPWAIKTHNGVKNLLNDYDDENNRLCMMLRVGHAKKEPVRSHRLPLERVTA